MTPEQYELLNEAIDALEHEYPDLYDKIQNARTVEILFPECGKVKYRHRETAQTAAKAMNKKTGDDYDAYQCAWCNNKWHIGHARKTLTEQDVV